MRMRYDFARFGSQISIQTLEQAMHQSVGATVGISPQSCTCDASIAGNMHIHAFEASDPLDPIKLPADKGGAAYLGRVKVTLDGDTGLSRRTAIADHYMKWAFHFLVDADKDSESYGLPLRLYGQQGVRFVYSGWDSSDPQAGDPELFKIPKHCVSLSKTCRDMKSHQDLKADQLVE